MAKYKFEQFAAEIINPTIDVVGVRDNMDATCSVDLKLSKSGIDLGITLTGFTYTDTWEDSDISSFVTTKLAEFVV